MKKENDEQTVEELEKVILWEETAEDPNSFMYQLHENSFFDTNKLDYLLSACYKLVKLYQYSGRTKNYFQVIKGLTTVFEYILFMITCHFLEDDCFSIKNYSEDLNSDKITNYYSQFREIREQLLDLSIKSTN